MVNSDKLHAIASYDVWYHNEKFIVTIDGTVDAIEATSKAINDLYSECEIIRCRNFLMR